MGRQPKMEVKRECGSGVIELNPYLKYRNVKR